MRSIGMVTLGLAIAAAIFVVGLAGWLVRKAERLVLG